MNITVPDTSPYFQLTEIKVDTLAPSLMYMLLCVALAASNQPKGIPIIMNHYLNQLETLQQRIHWIEYTRHGIMKSIVLCGGPRVINAQIELYNHLLPEYKALLRTNPLNVEEHSIWDTRGYGFFQQVYGVNSYKKQALIKTANPDLWYWVEEVYGNLVSDMAYLDALETELEVIVSLIQMDTLTQLDDHRQGALNVGATVEQVKAAEYIGYKVKQLA